VASSPYGLQPDNKEKGPLESWAANRKKNIFHSPHNKSISIVNSIPDADYNQFL